MNSQEKITFLGESLWQGNLGHVLVVLAFMFAVVSGIFYFKAASEENEISKKLGKWFFVFQAASVLGIFIVLFGIIFSHKYEYFYAWRHSSNSLPVYYMISCFWEGQEGSFLLWMFWNAVLGLIVIKTAGKFESPVMAVVCLAQVALGTMLLGLQIGDYHIGSSPFDLLREQKPEFLAGIPNAAGKAMYLKMVADGNGLNPLLQNYWMVIHPPTLFLGFATVLIPFAYSTAGLWKRLDREWISPALTWSLISVGILGTGIIMGGFWAYESLTFGGYWAWDPVENASLMPWLIVASAAHMLLISKNTGRHLFSAHLLIQISYWLVLYATFLTRSGILGEASVHSFTDLGLSGQLLVFLFGFIVISLISSIELKSMRLWILGGFLFWIGFLITMNSILSGQGLSNFAQISKYINIILFVSLVSGFVLLLYKRTKTSHEEEKWTSRELWMFIGAMFLILSLMQVFSSTSIPVFNKIFGTDTAVPKEAEYNRIQVWLAMPVMLLMAIGQWFRYRETNKKDLIRDISLTSAVSAIVFVLFLFGFKITEFKYMLFLFAATWLVTGNVMYFGKQKKMPWLAYGGSVAHAGFGILLIGVLVSSVNKKVLSKGEAGIEMAAEVDEKGNRSEAGAKFNRENRILYLGEPVLLDGYEALYRGYQVGTGGDSISKYFNVLFVKRKKNGDIADSFTLNPKAQKNPNMGLISEPSTRHYIHKDVFTHINHESSLDREEPFAGFKADTVKMGQTFLTSSGKTMFRLDSMRKLNYQNFLILQFTVLAKSLNDSVVLHPFYVRDTSGKGEEHMTDQSDELGVMLKVDQINYQNPDKPLSVVIMSAERSPRKNYIVLKAIEFPWINLVWAGTIIMVIGASMAVFNRIKIQKQIKME